MATHGYTLSQAAEDRITDALPVLAISIPEGPYLWNALREVLLGPHAAHALRTMHALGVLEMLIPEFHGIDALVIRDSYHRYTVDEHTFLMIDNVHGLRQPATRLRAAAGAAAAGDRPARSVSAGAAAARHGQGPAHRRTCHAKCRAGRQLSGAAGLRCRGARIDSEAHPAASGDVFGHAPRHLRPGQCARIL